MRSLVYLFILFYFCSTSFAKWDDKMKKPKDVHAPALSSACQGRPLFEVVKTGLLFTSGIKVTFCHGLTIESSYNENEVKAENLKFKVTYSDGHAEEVCGILVASIESQQIHIYHSLSSKLRKGALQDNPYNPSWYDQFIRGSDGKGFLRSLEPEFDSSDRNYYEFSTEGFDLRIWGYEQMNHLSNGKLEVVATAGGKYLKPNISGIYQFTPFLSLQEIYTGVRSQELDKQILCRVTPHEVQKLSVREDGLSRGYYLPNGEEHIAAYDVEDRKAGQEEYANVLKLECDLIKKGSISYDQKETQKFQKEYTKVFGSRCE
ncbi:MAG: hypothetical protein A4S09_11705 [Proteobacteria bacterium SG_bin7]|nr:MAG: hypothetical protein A4S09_11705 [Proteobacteria bacterium SG_bin7]